MNIDNILDELNIEDGEVRSNRYYNKFVLDNRYDFIDLNELYTIRTNGIEMISVPVHNYVGKYTLDKFTKNFNSKWAKVYTLYKLNPYMNNKTFMKAVIPFIKYQYNINDKEEKLLIERMNQFKNVLKISRMNKIEYKLPFIYIEPRYDENENQVYSTQESKKIDEMKKYKGDFNKKCKLILSIAIKYKIISYKDKIYKDEYKKKLNHINDILKSLKEKFDDIYLIKEKRNVILNTKKLFYMDIEYNKLSIEEYNEDDKKKKESLHKRMIEIERKYINEGIGILKKKINLKKVNYGITWLQYKDKITIKDLCEITGLSKPTIKKYLPISWKMDNKILF